MASKNNQGQTKHTAVSGWRQMMTSLYPDLQSSTICVPPVIVNKVPYTRSTVAGQPVLVVQQPSDIPPAFMTTPPPPPATSSMGLPISSKSLPPAVRASVIRFSAFCMSNILNILSGGQGRFSSTDLFNQTCDLTQTLSTSVDEAVTTTLGVQEADTSQNASGTAKQPWSPNQSQEGSQNQSQNGSPNQSQNGSPNQSQNGSQDQSQNGSPNQSQNGSPNQSQNGSQNQSQNGSPNQSQNGSPKPQNGSQNQSQNGSPKSQNGSPKSQNGSPKSQNGSLNQSQNGSPKSQNGSQNQSQNGSQNQSQNGSPKPQNGSQDQSQNGSPKSQNGSQNQSQNGSQNQSRNGSQNQSQNGSPKPQNGSQDQSQNGSPKSQNGSQNQSQNGSQNQSQNGSQNQSQNGSPNQSQNGSPNQSQNGSQNQSQNGSQNQSQNGSQNQSQNGSPNQSQNGSQNQSQNGSPNQSQNGSQNQSQNGSPNQSQNGSPNQSQNGSPNQSQNGSPNQSQNGSQNQSQNGSQNQSQNPSSFSMWTEDPSPLKDLRPVSYSDVRSDFTQQYLLTNLQTLGNARHEVMFVLSQLDFKSYLKDLSGINPKLFNRPVDLAKTGDFDILVIHRHYGVLIGEIKSVGMMHAQLNMAQDKRDADVKKRVSDAIKQLDKSEQVVRHVMSDLAPALMVRKTVMLPFVTSAQLLSILSNDSGLNGALCTCLGAANETEATRLCVCSDHLSDHLTPWKVTQADLSHLSSWWQQRMACTMDNSLTDDMYLDIVARFAGPATSVTVECTIPPRLQMLRTQGDAVSFLGETFARLILTPQQVDLLNRAPRRVYLKGPPGTGKTVTLVLMGLRWVLEGHDVYVCSQSYETRAVAELICHQIETTAALHVKSAAAAASTPASSASSSSSSPPSSSSVGKVHLLAYDMTNNGWEEIKKVMLDLAQLACKGGPLRLIFDEFMMGKGCALIDLWYMNPLMMCLEVYLKQHYVWMAGVTNHAMPPSVEEATFTIPLRCAPAIQREVQAGLDQWVQCGAAVRYFSHGIPAPSDGLSVTRLLHHGTGHSSSWPVDCEQCGLTIADLLHRQLRVRRPSAFQGGSQTSQDVACPAPLRYKDVFIVTRSSDLRDDVTDDAGQVVTSASGVVRGLRQAGVPLYVLDLSAPMNRRKKCQGVVSGMGLMSFDRVVVSFSTFLQGLERKIVVWLPGENHRKADEYMVESSEILDRVHALSLCTTQLVIVDLPQPREPDLD